MNIFVLMPGQGRISQLQARLSHHCGWPTLTVLSPQERQMTTVLDHNVHSIAVDGTSDDADVAVQGENALLVGWLSSSSGAVV